MVGMKASDAVVCTKRIIKALVARRRWGDQWKKPLPWAPCTSGEEWDGCEEATDRQRGLGVVILDVKGAIFTIWSVIRLLRSLFKSGQMSELWSNLDWWIFSTCMSQQNGSLQGIACKEMKNIFLLSQWHDRTKHESTKTSMLFHTSDVI